MAWSDTLDPGDVLGFGQDSRVAKANRALDEAQKRAEEASSSNRSLYSQYNNRVNSTYGDLAGKFNDYMNTFENQGV